MSLCVTLLTDGNARLLDVVSLAPVLPNNLIMIDMLVVCVVVVVGGLVFAQYANVSDVVLSVLVGSNLSPVDTIIFPGGRAPKAGLDPGGTSTSIEPDVERDVAMSRCRDVDMSSSSSTSSFSTYSVFLFFNFFWFQVFECPAFFDAGSGGTEEEQQRHEVHKQQQQQCSLQEPKYLNHSNNSW